MHSLKVFNTGDLTGSIHLFSCIIQLDNGIELEGKQGISNMFFSNEDIANEVEKPVEYIQDSPMKNGRKRFQSDVARSLF